MSTERVTEIPRFVEKYQPQMVEFLQELIKTPSVNGTHTEGKMVEVISQRLSSLKLPHKILSKDETRPNIFVGEGFEKKQGLLFVAHLDTASVGNEDKWKHKPFGAEVDGEFLFGRGAIDNKAGIVLSIYALKILSDLGYPSVAKFAGVSDEEKGADSTLGARYLLDTGLNAEAAIYTYSGTDTITIGHRGQVKLWVNVTGESVHSGSRGWQDGTKGASAIDALTSFLLNARDFSMKGTHPQFPGYGFKQTTVFISGGSISGMVPDKAQALLDARLLPNHNNEAYIEEIKKRTKMFDTSKIKFDVQIQTNLPAAFIAPEEKIVKILQELSEEVLGKNPEVRGCGPANEGYMFIDRGIPTVCGFGADGDKAHAADEYVDLQSLPKVLEVYIRAALKI